MRSSAFAVACIILLEDSVAALRSSASSARRQLLHAISLFVVAQMLSPFCLAQDRTEADEKVEQALVASSWSGEIRSFRAELYLLDDGLLILKVGDENPRQERWAVRGGKLHARIKLSDQIIVNLAAESRGDLLAGTAKVSRGDAAPLELHRNLVVPTELLAAAPPNRPYPPAPKTSPREFDGVYEMELPERIGENSKTVTHRLSCNDGACVYTLGKDVQARFDRLSEVRGPLFAHARFALQYARDHKSEAAAAAPYLTPLLNSGAGLRACINLGMSTMYAPGLALLCKTDGAPWKTLGVLLMGAIMSDNCRAFCRYEITPLLRAK